MPVGGRVKFSASPAEMLRQLRAAREFDHLRGMHLNVLNVTTNPLAWDEKQQRAYEAALPTLLLRERSLITSEDAIGHNRRIFPNAVLRRAAFLFGGRCMACGAIGYGYRMLPITNDIPDPKVIDRTRAWHEPVGEASLPALTFDMLRKPFIATLGDTIEPLCPHCRFSFAAWVCRFIGREPKTQDIEICATGWLAQRLSRNASVTAVARAGRPPNNGRKSNKRNRPALAVAGWESPLPSVRL